MSENLPELVWPPKRHRPHSLALATPPLTPTTNSRAAPIQTSSIPLTPLRPVFSDKKNRKNYRNGYEVKPKTPSYKPYTINNPGHPRHKAFAFEGVQGLKPHKPLNPEEWNRLAMDAGALKPSQRLKEFQMQCGDHIIARKGDLCLVAPTGAGKSLVWTLPLLAQQYGISLVVVPFTTLGFQGEERHRNSSIRCTFLHSGSQTEEVLATVAKGGDKQIVYACVEMLEAPSIARILYSESFQAQLSAIYIDEAHCVHESHSWRPGYTRLHQLRKIVGTDVPLICLSATLPERYRKSLEVHAGLHADYTLINLGNFRPELSTVISHMEHDASSFLDLAWVVPWSTTAESTIEQTLVYCDDLEMLTAMFWWFYSRLLSMGLSPDLVDILHAGLSESHQCLCIKDFIAGKTRILLGSDKIGAGMDFPYVRWVVQYRCRGLTLVRWEQRRGRGARRPGHTATGVILVEKSMSMNEGILSVDAPAFEDPALLALIHTHTCCEEIIDLGLENPLRDKPSPYNCGRCSICNPTLHLKHDLRWILEDPSAQTRQPASQITSDKKSGMYEMLKQWRTNIWRREWEEDWPSYGPDSLISDVDLDKIAKQARTIFVPDDIYSITQILHWSELSGLLFTFVKSTVLHLYGPEAVTTPPERSVHIEVESLPELQRRSKDAGPGKLADQEMVISFD